MSRVLLVAPALESPSTVQPSRCHEVRCCPLGTLEPFADCSPKQPWLWLPHEFLTSAPITIAGQHAQQPAKRRKTSSSRLDCLPSASAAGAACPSLTTDPLAAEDLLLSWYSLYQPRPNPTTAASASAAAAAAAAHHQAATAAAAAAAAAASAPAGSMLAAMSTLMMPAMTLAGHHNLHHPHPAAAALAGALGQHGQPHHHAGAAVSSAHHAAHHHAHHHHHAGQPKPADLLGLAAAAAAGHPGLPIAHLTLKAASVNGHGSAASGNASNSANGSSGGAANGSGGSSAGSAAGGSSSGGSSGNGSSSNGSAAGGNSGGGANGSGNGSGAGSGSSAEHFHIFVGDLSPEIETQTLRDAFAAFGEISDCRVVRDPQTLKSKGYGFVSYVKKSDAESAIAGMNGQWLGTRAIRTNWATRKPPAPKDAGSKPLSYEEVFSQSSSTNCTVYCGNLAQGTTEEALQKIFGPYGQIQEIRVFKDKGYAFIRFATKESATQAIVSVHNTDLNGQNVKCSWGKEPGEPGGANNAQLMAGGLGPANAQYPYGYNQSMGYWYPGSYPPQMPSQFAVQGMQGYAAYGQYGFQPGMSMQLPGGWQGVPTQAGAGAAMSGQQMAAAAAAAAAAVSQQGGMVASYPIQQFQAQ